MAKDTSPREASKAGSALANPNASKLQKSLAGSALRQVDPNAATTPKMAQKAAKALENPNSSKETKSLAGTVVSQADPSKK